MPNHRVGQGGQYLRLLRMGGGEQGILKKIAGLDMLGQQGFDLAAQGVIAGAAFLKHAVAAGFASVERPLENAFDLPPSVVIHQRLRPALWSERQTRRQISEFRIRQTGANYKTLSGSTCRDRGFAALPL